MFEMFIKLLFSKGSLTFAYVFGFGSIQNRICLSSMQAYFLPAEKSYLGYLIFIHIGNIFPDTPSLSITIGRELNGILIDQLI